MSFPCIQHCHCKLTGFDLVLYFIHISKKKKCKSLLNFMGGLFALKARRLLTIHLQNKYIKPKSMYTLVMNHEKVDNP